MMVIDKVAPKGSVLFRDALLFSKYSYDAVAKGKDRARLDALCDRIVQRAIFSLKMDEMTPKQMECIRKALLATAVIDGFDVHKKLSHAKREFWALSGIVSLASFAVGTLSGSAGPAFVTFLFGMPYSLLHSLGPRCNALCAYMGVTELQDKIWSVIDSGAKAGKEGG